MACLTDANLKTVQEWASKRKIDASVLVEAIPGLLTMQPDDVTSTCESFVSFRVPTEPADSDDLGAEEAMLWQLEKQLYSADTDDTQHVNNAGLEGLKVCQWKRLCISPMPH